MEFVKNAPVFTAHDEQVGHIERLVIDPKTKEVTHIVVRKGFIFTEDKVLPISLIASGGEQVTLRKNAGDLQAFPKFEERDYVLLDERERRRIASAETTNVVPVYPYPPYTGAYSTVASMPRVVATTERNIPDATIALEEGAEVISADGDHVGDIHAILTGPQANRVTHFVISQGLLLKTRKLVPVTWVSFLEEDKVHLAVGSDLLDRLREYEG